MRTLNFKAVILVLNLGKLTKLFYLVYAHTIGPLRITTIPYSYIISVTYQLCQRGNVLSYFFFVFVLFVCSFFFWL